MHQAKTEQRIVTRSDMTGAPTIPEQKRLPDRKDATRSRDCAAFSERVRTNSADAAFVLLVALAFRAHGSSGEAPRTRCYSGSGLAPWQLQRLGAFVDANLDGDLAVSDLAAACSLSPSHFSRAFSASMGVPPHRWLVRCRIERSKALLLGSVDRLSHIALACGFVDQSHFTRVFVRYVGESPGRWRRQHWH
jgi:AraC-like DNA-binding protein